jgi:hypothetical protein
LLPIVFISCVVNKKDTSILESKINIELRQELETVLLKDQGIRAFEQQYISGRKTCFL